MDDIETMKVGEVAAAAGLTVRTLHHWDSIGLLSPSERSPAGHRGYTEADLVRLGQVLGLRRPGLGLESIGVCLGAGRHGCPPRAPSPPPWFRPPPPSVRGPPRPAWSATTWPRSGRPSPSWRAWRPSCTGWARCSTPAAGPTPRPAVTRARG